MNYDQLIESVATKCGRDVPYPGDMYQHFKGMVVVVQSVAIHTETEEPLVIYAHGHNTWARPLEMFLSRVDKNKYPECAQEYRLEKVGS